MKLQGQFQEFASEINAVNDLAAGNFAPDHLFALPKLDVVRIVEGRE